MTTAERARATFSIYETARKKRGVTDYQVAKNAGISPGRICDWRYGRCTPKFEKLLGIANYLEIPVMLFYQAGGEK